MEDVAKVHSLSKTLTNFLKADDTEKIDTVLKTASIATVQATLDDLPIQQVLPLLHAIERMLTNRNIRPWLRWLHCTFSQHMPYLTTQNHLNKELSGLKQWLDSRARNFEQLLVLHGKVSLIVEQVEARTKKTPREETSPLLVFGNDSLSEESSDENMEDEEALASEDDWWMENDENEDESMDEDHTETQLCGRKRQFESGSEADDDEDDEVDEGIDSLE